MPAKALLIPTAGPVEEITLDGGLAQLQELVGGMIQAIPVPEFITDRPATAYINEEGKYTAGEGQGPNMRATDFMVPGVGLFADDYVSGPFIVCGVDPRTGDNIDVPGPVKLRVRLIEREAA